MARGIGPPLTQNFFWLPPRGRFTAIADLMQNFLKQKSQHNENFAGIGFAVISTLRNFYGNGHSGNNCGGLNEN